MINVEIKQLSAPSKLVHQVGDRTFHVDITSVKAVVDNNGNISQVEMAGQLEGVKGPTITQDVTGENIAKGFVNFYQQHLFTVDLKFASPQPASPPEQDAVVSQLVNVLKRRLNDDAAQFE